MKVRLFHWNASEAKQKISVLESSGFKVDYQTNALLAFKELKKDPSAIVIIDLSRLPSQGRDIAINIRHAKVTRNIPIIFVNGDRQKVEQIKLHVPDAIYTDYSQIRNAIEGAIANPPRVKTIPKSVFEPYSRVPLAKKLEIKSCTTLALINPPVGFEKTLAPLPQDIKILNRISIEADLVMLFAENTEDLQIQLPKILDILKPNGKLWIAWQKKIREKTYSVTQEIVRKTGLALGLVDYKIARIDATWTGLLFSRRKPDKLQSLSSDSVA